MTITHCTYVITVNMKELLGIHKHGVKCVHFTVYRE